MSFLTPIAVARMQNDILQPMKAMHPSWTSIIVAGVLAASFAVAVLISRMDALTAFALIAASSLSTVAALLALAFVIALPEEKSSVLAHFLNVVRDAIQSRR